MEAKIDRVVETILYVEDLEQSRQFYQQVLNLSLMVDKERFCAFNLGAASVLLLFIRGDSLGGQRYPEGYIPPHDGRGPHHIGFAIAKEQLPLWQSRLERYGVAIEGRMSWPYGGGESLYFRDPDDHLLELITPGIWPNY